MAKRPASISGDTCSMTTRGGPFAGGSACRRGPSREFRGDASALGRERPLTFSILVIAGLTLVVPMVAPRLRAALARRREQAGEGG